jgi:hypothetical protein
MLHLGNNQNSRALTTEATSQLDVLGLCELLDVTTEDEEGTYGW